jgi:hypothetical protein
MKRPGLGGDMSITVNIGTRTDSHTPSLQLAFSRLFVPASDSETSGGAGSCAAAHTIGKPASVRQPSLGELSTRERCAPFARRGRLRADFRGRLVVEA